LILYSALKNSNRFLTLVLFGAILACSAELPYGGWIQIPILTLVWWGLLQFKQASLKQFFLAGLVFGLGYFVVGLSWIYISLHDVGRMNFLLSCAAVVLLSTYTAVFFALASLPLYFFKQASFYTGCFLAASWVLIECLRGFFLTGFPWLGLAEAQVNGPFGLIAPYLGGLACTFFAVWSSWQLLHIRKHVAFSIAPVALVIILVQILGLWSFTKPTGSPLSVELVQGNFSQSLIFRPEGVMQQIDYYSNVMKRSSAELVVAPETALSWPDINLPSGTLESLQESVNQHHNTLLFGIIGRRINPADGREFSNRALGLNHNTPSYQYDKSHLVPFGEFIPPGFHWFVNAFNVPLSDFSRGSMSQPPFMIVREGKDPLFAAITICYEDVFGSELATRLRHSSEPTNLLINITNLAWFGDSQAPAQQLRLSQLRSLETGLPALRATNTGITAILGPDGKVIQQLPKFTQTALVGSVQAYTGRTPYVIWGNAPILTISFLLLLIGIIRQRQF